MQSELTVYNGGIQKTTTTYSYNSNGQLIKSITSSSSPGVTSANSMTYTYSYDAAGNVITALTEGVIAKTNVKSIGSYEYSGGRLTKIVSESSSNIFPSTTDSYSYDGSGQIATYSTTSSDPKYGTERYTFTNGLLTGGTITRGGQSLTVTAENGRITSIANPDGSKNRYTYDANGYNTRYEYFDKAGTLQSYTTNEYSTTGYKQARTPYQVIPAINLYGNTELPLARVASYNANGSLKNETLYQYQVNGKGYITGLSYVQNQTGVSGQSTGTTTYTYSNCR